MKEQAGSGGTSEGAAVTEVTQSKSSSLVVVGGSDGVSPTVCGSFKDLARVMQEVKGEWREMEAGAGGNGVGAGGRGRDQGLNTMPGCLCNAPR